jgi:transposase
VSGRDLRKFTSSKSFDIVDRKMSVETLTAENILLKSEIERLYGIIKLMKRDQYGAKSERVEEIPAEQLIFNEIEAEAALPRSDDTETITYKRKKGRQPKKPFPEHLAREERLIDIAEEEKRCPHDGHRLKEIGEERTEKLKTIPAQMSVIVEIKKEYACPHCESHMAQGKSPSILPGTIATPELLAFIVYSKFFQALPLYRLEEQFRLNGIALKRGTMARWLVQLNEPLMPLYNLLQEKAFEGGYMAIDATHLQVLKEKGRLAEAKSFMWARGSPERGIVLFDYDVSGGGGVAKRLMAGFSGALQADAHRGYGALDLTELRLLGCMMHSRRRFHDAFLIGKKQPGLASEAIAMFKWLYDKEESYKKKGLTPAERKTIRDKEIGPSLAAMKEWSEAKLQKVPKKSPIGNALNYFIAEYGELTAFLADGRYEMDNGWIERSIRKFAIGRNNWLFSDSVEGAHSSALLYSLAVTAKLNGKNPFEVLTEIFSRLPMATTADDYENLVALLLSPTNPLSCQKKDG